MMHNTKILNMKTIKYILTVFSMIVILSSCMDDFLKEEVYSNLAPSNFYKTEADAIATVSAVYNNFQIYGNEWWNAGNAYMCMTDGVTDIMFAHWFTSYETYTYNSSSGEIYDVWKWCYNTNNNANIAIGRLPDIAMDETLKARLIGEAKFLRAMNYFNLVRFWGDVPYIDYEIKGFGDVQLVSRDPQAEVYQNIIQDLQDAIAVLPVSYSSPLRCRQGYHGSSKGIAWQSIPDPGMGRRSGQYQ